MEERWRASARGPRSIGGGSCRGVRQHTPASPWPASPARSRPACGRRPTAWTACPGDRFSSSPEPQVRTGGPRVVQHPAPVGRGQPDCINRDPMQIDPCPDRTLFCEACSQNHALPSAAGRQPRRAQAILVPGAMDALERAVVPRQGGFAPAVDPSTLQLIILPAGLIAVAFALFLARDVLRRHTGTQAMQDVAATIYEGAVAFIKRQYTTIGALALVGAVVIFVLISLVETTAVADTSHSGVDLGLRTGFAFLVGAACSMACGIIGMLVSVRANVRVASAARRSLVEAVQVAMRGGAVSGFLVVSLSLLGVWSIFAINGGLGNGDSAKYAPFL